MAARDFEYITPFQHFSVRLQRRADIRADVRNSGATTHCLVLAAETLGSEFDSRWDRGKIDFASGSVVPHRPTDRKSGQARHNIVMTITLAPAVTDEDDPCADSVGAGSAHETTHKCDVVWSFECAAQYLPYLLVAPHGVMWWSFCLHSTIP